MFRPSLRLLFSQDFHARRVVRPFPKRPSFPVRQADSVRDSEPDELIYGLWSVKAVLEAKKRTVHKLILQDRVEDDLGDRRGGSKDQRAEDYVRAIEKLAAERKIPVEYASRKKLSFITKDRPHQGMVLSATPLEVPKVLNLTRAEVDEKSGRWSYQVVCRDGKKIDRVTGEAMNGAGRLPPPVWLALDQVVDPQNLGAILRTAYFFGVDGVVRCQRESAPLSSVASKASSGALEVMSLYSAHNLGTFLQDSANSEWDVVGTTVSEGKSIPVGQLILQRPTIVTLGNEGEGLRPSILRHCTRRVTISSTLPVGGPTGPIVESLNVSVATGIILHQLLGSARH